MRNRKTAWARNEVNECVARGTINSDLRVLLRHHVQALGGQLSYTDRHRVLPVEKSDRLGMG
jgi:hypothetical protein